MEGESQRKLLAEEDSAPVSFCRRIFCDKRVLVALLAVVSVTLTLCLPQILGEKFFTVRASSIPEECQLAYHMRLDCFPTVAHEHATIKSCEEMGCCWDRTGHCFHSYSSDTGHVVDPQTELLCVNGTLKGRRINVRSSANRPHSNHSKPVDRFSVTLGYVSESILQIRIHPEPVSFPLDDFLDRDKLHDTYKLCDEVYDDKTTDLKYEVSDVDADKPFGLKVTRKKKGVAIFATDWAPFLFHEQFLELTTVLPSTNVYGLGENPRVNLKHDLQVKRTWPLFAQDHGRYGAHPFYLCLEENGTASGVLVSSGNAMDVTVGPAPSVTFRSTGSYLLLHVFVGPTPDDVISQLTSIVGRPALPPFWALGHHDCRPDQVSSTAIPVESSCVSLKDPSWPNDIKRIVESQKKVIVVDSPRYLSDLDSDDDRDFFVESKGIKYLDVFRENAERVLLRRYSKMADSFDGLMLIDNAPLSDGSGGRCPDDDLNYPPYNPLGKEPLSSRTICMGVCHGGDKCSGNLTWLSSPLHYNLHNIYGMKHAHAAHWALRKKVKGQRPFLTSLSTFPGSGEFGGSWGGEPNTTWEDLRKSLVRSLEFNLYGIPLTGTPACGSLGDPSSVALCVRWWQMAVFQPLLLSYRVKGHELEKDDNLQAIVRDAVIQRYTLLPYLYTLLYKANVSGTPVMRPLFMDFARDPQTYDISTQFLWGSAVLVSPVLTETRNNTMVAYVPSGCWYNYYSWIREFTSVRGQFYNLSVSMEYVSVHFRGGFIVPVQKVSPEIRSKSLMAIVALKCLGDLREEGSIVVASGELFVDDGVSELHPMSHFLVRMEVIRVNRERNSRKYLLHLAIRPDDVIAASKNSLDLTLDTVFVLGQEDTPCSCYFTDEPSNVVSFAYHDKTVALALKNLHLDLRAHNNITCEFC